MRLDAYLKQMSKDELVALAIHMARQGYWRQGELANMAYSIRWESCVARQKEAWDRYESASKAWMERRSEIVPQFNESRDFDLKSKLAKEMVDRSGEVKRLWEAHLKVEREATKIFNAGRPAVDR